MKLTWDGSGQKFYETGVKQCALYVQSNGAYPSGVAWNGITAITENPSGAEATPLYADDIKYLELRSTEEFGATIEAYTYPDAFAECDGTDSIAEGVLIGQQARKAFGLAYKTTLGNDTDNNNYGYKLHLIYGATASPSQKSYATINDSPEAITFSWEVTTTPVSVTGYKPTSIITIDSTKADDDDLAALEDILFGIDASAFDSTKTSYAVGDYVTYTSGSPSTTKTYKCKTAINSAGAWDAAKWDEVDAGPRLPLPDEIATLFA